MNAFFFLKKKTWCLNFIPSVWRNTWSNFLVSADNNFGHLCSVKTIPKVRKNIMNEKTNENLAVEARISKPPEERLNTERIVITRERREGL